MFYYKKKTIEIWIKTIIICNIQLGVPAGSYFSQMIRHKTPNADPIVCAVTLLCSVPVLFFGFVSANYSISLCYGLTFLAG